MKKKFSIFLLIFFVSANINAEITGVDTRDLTQLYNHSEEYDQHFFELKEEPLGIYNQRQIEFCLGIEFP